MKKIYVIFLIILSTYISTFSYGTIYISNILELQKIGNDPAYPLNEDYELTQDIDASGTISLNNGEGFIPIGSMETPFTGTFNGNGKKIRNLFTAYYSSTLGLFGCVDTAGEIKNLGIENIWITSQISSYSGGLIGYLKNGIVTNCFSTGIIIGGNPGGLIGEVEVGGLVSDCYAIGYCGGGFVGTNYGTIIRCYAITEPGNGFCFMDYGTITDCYWEINPSGKIASKGASGKTPSEMKQQSTFAGWDFTETWDIQEGITYPYLRVLGLNQDLPSYGEIEIRNLDDLNKIGRDWNFPLNGMYRLISDIDATETIEWNNGAGFLPILVFAGKFNGNGHKITNLYINIPGESSVGLFNKITSSGEVFNLTIENSWVSGFNFVGILAGTNDGNIHDCSVEGAVFGNDNVGGLVGFNNKLIEKCNVKINVSGNTNVGGLVGNVAYNQTEVVRCYSTGAVYGFDSVGGLIGLNYSHEIHECYSSAEVYGGEFSEKIGGLIGYNARVDIESNVYQCYAVGSVAGSKQVGGLIGYNSAPIEHCYSSGSVSGEEYVGGLIGYAGFVGWVLSCFWDIETSGQYSSQGGIGLTTINMKKRDSFTDWDFENVWTIIEDETYPYFTYLGETQTYLPTMDEEKEIWSLEDLSKIGRHWDYLWNREYILMVNIDAAETIHWNNGSGFYPIVLRSGSTFNGNGHKIQNIYINRKNETCTGLFSVVFYNSVVKDLGTENIWVKGDSFVGGLIGHNLGKVSNCYVTGGIVGVGHVGGLIGYNSSGVINSCYSKARVSGRVNVGGLIGSSRNSLIYNCYSLSEVKGTKIVGGLLGTQESYNAVFFCYSAGLVSASYGDAGGLIGVSMSNNVINCYWDKNTSGQYTSLWGIGKTTDEMKQQTTYQDWDFDETWGIVEGETYPYLQIFGQEHVQPIEEINEKEITNLSDLNKIGKDWNYPWFGKYKLTNNIDAVETITWNNGKGWKPITLTGEFDGDNHAIKNLYINRFSESDVGLFDNVYFGGSIKNLQIVNAWISGNNSVGAVAGQNLGVISNCSSINSNVVGYYDVGGLVGQNFYGNINTSFAINTVKGSKKVGGLVGTVIGGTVIKCYSSNAILGNSQSGGLVGLLTGDEDQRGQIIQCFSASDVISFDPYVGGLVGYLFFGNVEESYSVGRVTGGKTFIGGLAGYMEFSSVNRSYWDIDTSNQTNSAGGEGRNTVQMMSQGNYVNWDFTNVWTITEGQTYPCIINLPCLYENITVPNLIGLEQTEAEQTLTEAGLVIGNVSQQCSDTISAGRVISQDPESGQSLPLGGLVDIVVSAGPCTPLTAWIDMPSEIIKTKGEDLELKVLVEGVHGNANFQWYYSKIPKQKEAVPIPGENGDTLLITNIQIDDSGWYWCEVTDDLESVETNAVHLIVILGMPISSLFSFVFLIILINFLAMPLVKKSGIKKQT